MKDKLHTALGCNFGCCAASYLGIYDVHCDNESKHTKIKYYK